MRSNEIEERKKGLKLRTDQRETLIGLLLGDAHLETQNNGRTYRLKIEQSEQYRPYVFHLYEIFEKWTLTPPRKRKVKNKGRDSYNYCVQTVSHGALRFYGQQFYGDKRKVVPKLIHRWLTPRSLAYWYMDDGSLKSHQSKEVVLNTQGFSEAEVERLIAALTRNFKLEAKKRKQKEGYQVYISGRSFERFEELVRPYIIPEMMYKIPKTRST